jgi:RNA polymerase sigma-70 factor (ECF subfamily)
VNDLDVETLSRRYGAMVLRRCHRLLGSQEEAEDACQDVFLRLMERRQRLNGVYPSSLLYRMATNLCLNRIRDQRRRPVTLDEQRLHRIAFAEDPGALGNARMLLDRLFDPLEFLARVIVQIPEPKRHLLFYCGHYANVVRGRRRKIAQASQQSVSSRNERQEDQPTVSPARKQALRRRWADLIRRVLELDPLLCPCGGTLRVVAFITEPRAITKILEHLKNKAHAGRAPPLPPTGLSV